MDLFFSFSGGNIDQAGIMGLFNGHMILVFLITSTPKRFFTLEFPAEPSCKPKIATWSLYLDTYQLQMNLALIAYYSDTMHVKCIGMQPL